MDTNNPVNPQASNNQTRESQVPASLTEVKKSCWKIGFFVILLLWLLSVTVLVLDFNNRASKPDEGVKQPTELSPAVTTAPSDITKSGTIAGERKISVRIDPYRADEENGQIIATFQITNLHEEIEIDKVTYWTDKKGACQAETQPFTELVKIPVDGADFSFFQFTDIDGNTSEIYASSHNPIFQCGDLAE